MIQLSFNENEIYERNKIIYENGQPMFDIIPSKCALLVIDMQDEFVKPNWTLFWVPEATKQVPKIKRMIEYCRTKNIPIIYTLFSDTHKFLDRPRYSNFMANRYNDFNIEERSSWFSNSKIWHELQPLKEDIVIFKPSYGAFYDTPLETILKNLGKDTVIICGTLTNFCCSTTARQAYERGYKVVFGSDINSADDINLHEMELKVLRKGFAKVITLNEIIKELG